ncbi:MAG TPA: hypothetical protein VMU77_05865, partial [Acidimicrobiales bacterium]|nr:hypothetical protein [Acidimicrobiales bacterium]
MVLSQAPSKQVWIVPHTHWDREWYRPFQDFRVRLVELVDGLMELLEADPSYSKFMLDGQMAVIDDYLEIRPDALEQIEQMAKSGRISLGPWYILMDEFLVSGETIVRDLQLGIMRAEAFGGPMEVGYLPDMFGHIAQMPQILTLAGLDHAIVWRGVPAAIDRTRFTWRSPDGSSVVADYLINGYGNAAALPSDPKAAVEMLRSLDRESESFSFGNSDGILLMNGTDHQAPRTWLAGVVEQMNSMQDSYSLEICGLQDAVTARDNSLPESSELIQWEGELRSSARANLLMGVGSNRIDVKQAAARAERSLERRAEPLAALFAGADRWPDTFFNLAWKQMILNSAHDSICACSVDEVVDAVLARFAEARQIGDTVGDRVLDKFALSLSSPGATVVNLAHRDRSGTIKVIIPGEDVPAGCQLISSRPETLIDTKMAGPQAKAILAELRSQQISDDTFINSVEIAVRYDEIEVCLAASDKLENEFPIDPAKARLSGFIDAHPDLPVHIRATQPPISTVLARTPSVPGFGWRHWAPEIPEQPVGPHGNLGLTNGLVTVEVDPISGTFSLDGIAGFDRLVDGGDHGDTYNFSPPVNDTVVT